jgi:methionyl aminopeptidase
MVSIKSDSEIAKMRAGGRILAGALDLGKQKICPGITTAELENEVANYVVARGGELSFHNFRGYPARVCVSLNEEVVHGIPGSRKVKKGDIVSIDVGVRYKGMYTDGAFTKIVGPAKPEVEKLVNTTAQALMSGIAVIAPGATLGDIGATISAVAAPKKLAVIRDLVGHGVGYRVHEDPQIPNWGEAGRGLKLEAGMTLALEPMLALGSFEVNCLDDGWTFVTADGQPAAHFEHTVAVTKTGFEILTE